MRIVCPECSATYEVPDSMLVAARPVRCARCAYEWTPEPPPHQREAHDPETSTQAGATGSFVDRTLGSASTQTVTAILDRPAIDEGEPESAKVAPRSPGIDALQSPTPAVAARSALVGWGSSVVVLIVLVWAAYTWRVPIMEAWPPSERLFAALGLT